MSTRPGMKVARGARSSRLFQVLARAGFAVNGLVHTIIGLVAIGVAAGTGGQADHSGALAQVAASPGGTLILWVGTIGLAALGLWLLFGAFLALGSHSKRRVARFLVEAGKGAAYLLLAGTALTFARGGSSNSESDVAVLSVKLIAAPGGVLVLWVLALLVCGVGVYFVAKGTRRRFIEDITLPGAKRGRAIIAVGVFGYVAKGVALGLSGLLLAAAAFRLDPSQAAGLDGSLKVLAALPAGQLFLVVIGLGFMAYGAYCFVRARIAQL
ncbi:MAG: DUF1206 domain-containing protein [Rhodoglobus sp.]|nr:DUF1206 domain-containing protein [Rhodoglobus sp.]